jgi:hypothetical protein
VITSIGFVKIAMLLLSTLFLIASIGYDSSILAFMGLGLVFWGAILLYIKPEEYTKKVPLEAVLSSSLTTLNQMIREFSYKGDATYLPPKYFANPDTTKVYVSKSERGGLPTPEQTQLYENQPVARTTQGMLITPPGMQLSKLLEKSLGTSFIKTDLKNLRENLPTLFVENLIAENLEMQAENHMTEGKKNLPTSFTHTHPCLVTIHARIIKPIYHDMFKESREPSQVMSSIGCPICSAIAIAIAKATGKPVRITDTRSSEDGNTIEVNYEIIED